MAPQAALILRMAALDLTKSWFQDDDRGRRALIMFSQYGYHSAGDDVVYQGAEEYLLRTGVRTVAQDMSILSGLEWNSSEVEHLPTTFSTYVRHFRCAEVMKGGGSVGYHTIAFDGLSLTEIVSMRIEEIAPELGNWYRPGLRQGYRVL